MLTLKAASDSHNSTGFIARIVTKKIGRLLLLCLPRQAILCFPIYNTGAEYACAAQCIKLTKPVFPVWHHYRVWMWDLARAMSLTDVIIGTANRIRTIDERLMCIRDNGWWCRIWIILFIVFRLVDDRKPRGCWLIIHFDR